MKKKRLMVIGAVDSGKTTLLNALNNKKEAASKTQSLEYTQSTIDTPGEFLENRMYYTALFATSLEAELIIFVQDASSKKSVFSPGFAQAFSKKTLGVITKIDHPDADVKRATKELKRLGLNGPIIKVSAFTGEGIEELKKIINWND